MIVGSDYTDVGSPTELGYNARIAANLGAPVLLVLGGRDQQRQRAARHAAARTPDEMGQIAELALAELAHERARAARASSSNRADPERARRASPRSASASGAAASRARVPVWAIPEDRVLVAPSMRGILRAVDGDAAHGRPATCSTARRSASSSPACRW